jgi:hypothetical protein
MATVTPNFNWPVPTSTDLVKDGATAIEALGDSIDASLVDLKGGTTGQVLSKTSGTDMDFTWVTTDDANAIQNSIVDAKGDLISATANDTPARLAVGANGETLVADSSTSTGLRYQVPVNVNPVLNSAFQVWQRGTTITGAAAITYSADRWMALRDAFVAGFDVSRQVTNDTTNLPFIQYCARVQRTAGNTGLQFMWMANNFESINSIPYAGKTVTLSFYARAGANYSSASNVLQARLYSGLGTDQNIATGYTGTATPIDQNATLTTTWQRFSYTATVASAATELAIRFGYTPVGTAGANDYYEVTGVQLEVGSVATPFKTYAGTLQGELAACQYYYKPTLYGIGKFTSTTAAVLQVNYGIMRVAPSVVFVSGGIDEIGTTTRTATAITALGLGGGTGFISFTVSGATSGAICGSATNLLFNASSEL